MNRELYRELYSLSGRQRKRVAAAVGVAPRIVSAWMAGLRRPTRKHAKKLVKVLTALSVDRLIGKPPELSPQIWGLALKGRWSKQGPFAKFLQERTDLRDIAELARNAGILPTPPPSEEEEEREEVNFLYSFFDLLDYYNRTSPDTSIRVEGRDMTIAELTREFRGHYEDLIGVRCSRGPDEIFWRWDEVYSLPWRERERERRGE